jgi:alpha-glucosidase
MALAGLSLFGAWLSTASPAAQADPQRFKFSAAGGYLVVEVLDDDLIHFEVSGSGPGPGTSEPLFATPQVAKTDYAGPSTVTQSGPGGSTLDTPETRVAVEPANLCITVTDKVRGQTLTTVCPLNLDQSSKGLTITPGPMQHVYGLGEQLVTPGVADGDWTGRLRTPGDDFGNQMVGFGGGAASNVQIPVMYAIGPDDANYALFLDQVYKQRWDFTGTPWKVETLGDAIRFYVMTGPDLPDLRRDYLELTGHPPVPPRKLFGLWVSEYGYDNWGELEGKLSALRADQFPVDGFVLDLQWFGGISPGSDNSNMGRVAWDLTRFPDPQTKLADYQANEGIGIMVIEESYVAKGRPEHADLASRGFLARAGCAACAPVYLTGNPWWGKGGMIDWTQDAAGDYWHDLKRQPLIADGVIGHWIDLGEPEMYDPNDWTAGVLPGKHGQADYHNLYNLKWAEGIARGYARNADDRRPFMMARSGAGGIQRFGTALWSGDIGSNLDNLDAHLNAQMHMSLSGVDYFGADIGGFHRGALGGGNLDEMYTQWFANGAMLDVPVRPHTENLCNCKETAPDRIGNKASNLANIRERYALTPYLYSLAHRAYREGEPLMPPLVYYYQNDPNVRELGNEKLIGRDLLVATVTQFGASTRDVYLPAGDWVDLYSNEWLHSAGETFQSQPVVRDQIFRVPAYARAGALIPRMYVDEKTLNVLGKRSDGTRRDELIVRAYASETPTSFTLYEDDGETTAYRSGAVRTTVLSQQRTGGAVTVAVAPASGTYGGASASRNNLVELVVDNAQGGAVTLNGTPLQGHPSVAAFEAAASGWVNAGKNLIRAKSGELPVSAPKEFAFSLEAAPERVSQRFECRNGSTVWGQSVYAVGNVAALGNWSPAKAVKLNPDGPYPTWTGVLLDLPPATAIEWKCIKRPEATPDPVQWQPGANNAFVTPAAGFGGTTIGDFSGSQPPSGGASANFVCDNGTTTLGESVYVVGSVARLGNWDAAQAVKLDPTAYPRWTGTIANLPAGTAIDWKCVKRPEATPSPAQWEPGANNALVSGAAGSSVTSYGDFRP